jgi:hypothetical protein
MDCPPRSSNSRPKKTLGVPLAAIEPDTAPQSQRTAEDHRLGDARGIHPKAPAFYESMLTVWRRVAHLVDRGWVRSESQAILLRRLTPASSRRVAKACLSECG